MTWMLCLARKVSSVPPFFHSPWNSVRGHGAVGILTRLPMAPAQQCLASEIGSRLKLRYNALSDKLVRAASVY